MISIKLNIYNTNKIIKSATTSYWLVFVIFLVLSALSFCCLLKTRRIIDKTKQYSKTFGTVKVYLKDEYNPGFREFILSVILPMISTFSIDDYPITTLIMICIFQLLIYIFFINSSDFFPNISLVILGYSVFTVSSIISSKNTESNLKFVFGKNQDIDKVVRQKKYKFTVVEIGEPQCLNNIGVIK